MPFTIDVSGPIRAAAALRGINEATLSKAQQRAMSTLVRRLPVAARRDIQEQFTLRAGTVNDRLQARQQGGSVVLIGRAKGIALNEFKSNYSRPRGFRVQVQKSGRMVPLRAAWIGKSERVFRREKDGSTKSGFVGRSPFRPLFGPSVAAMLRNADRRERLGELAAETLRIETDRLIDSALRG